MTGVLQGFAVVTAVIVAGVVIGRLGLLGPHAKYVLSRIVFFVLSPCLLFTVLAEADVHVLFSRLLAVSALAAAVCFAVYGVITFLVWRRPLADAVVGTMSSGYVNANNIGLPLAVYILGDGAYTAPVILLQLVVFTPVVLALLDAATGGTVSVRTILLQPVRNPLIIASAAGVLLSVFDVRLPALVMEPFRFVGAAAVPVVLISFGMSLAGARVFQAGTGRRADIALATLLKTLLMPTAAWLLGRAFGLAGQDLFAVVVLATLPSAQNVFNYAQRFEAGETIARDTVFLTTILSIPALLAVSALLAPG